MDDLVADCQPGGEDESILASNLQKNTYYTCEDNHKIPCRMGHSKCYGIGFVCKYQFDDFKKLIPCRTGEHLGQCKEFECNTMHKCPSYYCIPWSYVCDGKWDCPRGTDEALLHQCGPNRNCSSMFKCQNGVICIHVGCVCDGHFDCPSMDDEQFCSLHATKCHFACQCLMSAIMCKKVLLSPHIFKETLNFRIIMLHNVSVLFSVSHFDFSVVFILVLKQTNFSQVCDLKVEKINFIDVSFNKINHVSSRCFFDAAFLAMIQITNNNISQFPSLFIKNVPELLLLNLSNNPILELGSFVFGNVACIKFVSLINVPNIILGGDIFDIPTLTSIQTNNFGICCVAPDAVHCTAGTPWFKSCTGILSSSAIKVAFYCGSSIILILNTVSLLLARKSYKKGKQNKKKSSFEILVAFINLNDTLLVVALCALWIADLAYSEHFLLAELKWRSSFFCYFTFDLLLHFNLLSPMNLCLLAFARLRIVDNPMGTNFKRVSYVFKCNLGLFVIVLLIVIVLTLIFWSTNTFLLQVCISTSLCSPFFDPTNDIITMKFITYKTVSVQTICIFAVICIHSKLIISRKKSQDKLRGTVSKQQSNKGLIFQLVIITVTNMFCWISCCIICLTALFMMTYPIEMIFWATIAVNPINSVVIPLVFVVTAIRKIIRG